MLNTHHAVWWNEGALGGSNQVFSLQAVHNLTSEKMCEPNKNLIKESEWVKDETELLFVNKKIIVTHTGEYRKGISVF